MLRVSISPEDLSTIHHDRFYHPQPYIMMRMHILALHHAGENAARIAVLLNRNRKTTQPASKPIATADWQPSMNTRNTKKNADSMLTAN
jgi:hypothetical protein